MHAKRLKKLIEFMEGLPREARKHFHMGKFLDHSGKHKHPAPKSKSDLLHSCGTTACALGWAATMPYFQNLGLYFTKSGRVAYRGMSVIAPTWSDEWSSLFGAQNRDRTPKQWAKRARKLLRQWTAA